MNLLLSWNHWKIRMVIQKLFFPIVLFLQSLDSVTAEYWVNEIIDLGTSLHRKIENSSIYRSKICNLYLLGVFSQEQLTWFFVPMFSYSKKIPKLKFPVLFALKFCCWLLKTQQNFSFVAHFEFRYILVYLVDNSFKSTLSSFLETLWIGERLKTND